MICLLLAAGSAGIAIDPNNRVFFSEQHEQYRELLDFEAVFGTSTSLVFVITNGKSLDQSQDVQQAVKWLTAQIWRVPHVTAVNSIATFPKVDTTTTEVNVTTYLDFICDEEEQCDPKRASALDSPVVANNLVSADRRSFAIVGGVDLFEPDARQVDEIFEAAQVLRQEFVTKFSDFRVYLTGGVPMMRAFVDAAAADSARLMPIAIMVLFGLLWLFFGGVVPALIMMLLGVISVASTMGVAGWFGHVLNTATATVPLITFTLVISNSMHLFFHILREDLRAPTTGIEDIVSTAVRANWKPMLLTSGTTVLGLASMLSVSAPP
ncbi:MAG: MMPL family transporter [Pseudomonadales bacterium]